MRNDRSSKWLKVRVAYEPIESEFQVAEGVLESFCPILWFTETLCYGVVSHFVIFNPANTTPDYNEPVII